MQTEQHDQETTATALEEEPQASFVISSPPGPVKVAAVPQDLARLLGEQRIRIEIGPLTVFVTRDAIPALVSQLLAVQAMTPVEA